MGSGFSRLRALGLAAILACGVVTDTPRAQQAASSQDIAERRQELLRRLRVLQERQAAAPTRSGALEIAQTQRELDQLSRTAPPPDRSSSEPPYRPPSAPPQRPPPDQPPYRPPDRAPDRPIYEPPPSPPADVEKARELFRSGPSTPPPGRSPTFAITGFIREGWPVVMDFEPQPGTRTELTVALLTTLRVSRQVSFLVPVPQGSRVVDEDGSGGRQLLHLRQGPLSGGDRFGERPVQIAEYGLVSYRLTDDGRIAKDEKGKAIRAPVIVRGFGAGPRAAGSVTINRVLLTPASLGRPVEGGPVVTADYSYFAEKAFDQADADIWLSCAGSCSKAHALGPDTRYLASSGWVRGTWKLKKSAKPGSYQLFVRAWLHCNGGDSGDNYRGCGDEAAWATGYSDPLTLQ